MRKIHVTAWHVVCLCLAALCIGLIVLNAVNFSKLQKFEQTYSLSNQGMVNDTQQQTINALSEEIVNLKNQQQATSTQRTEQLVADMRSLVTNYFLVDNNHPATDRMDNISSFLTDKLRSELLLKFQNDVISEGSSYRSSVKLSDAYILSPTDDTQTKVLLLGTVTISTTWGETESTILIEIQAIYDSAAGKWLANTISTADQISFSAL